MAFHSLCRLRLTWHALVAVGRGRAELGEISAESVEPASLAIRTGARVEEDPDEVVGMVVTEGAGLAVVDTISATPFVAPSPEIRVGPVYPISPPTVTTLHVSLAFRSRLLTGYHLRRSEQTPFQVQEEWSLLSCRQL